MRTLAISLLTLCSIAVAAPAAARDKAGLAPGARYVAIGSSFASGSGVAPYDPSAPARCQRSTQNFARQLARKRKLALVDVSCGGATTANVLLPWNELPPQVDALTPETALVSITIGGNDVGYIGGLIVGSCGQGPASGASDQPLCRMIAASRHSAAAGAMPTATEEGWRKLDSALTAIVQEVRRRSPHARIVLVDYLNVMPAGALCAQTPLSSQAADTGRATAARLAQLTANVARHNGAEVLAASSLSHKGHSACDKTPWVAGFIPPPGERTFVPYHPNLAGMSAIAGALDRQLGR